MSWKGFKKAVERLPQRVLSKAGYAEETIDPEFTEYEIQFKLLCEQTKKLADDAVKFKDALTNMLSHQAVFAETLLDLYQPISGSSRGVVTSPGGTTTVTATKTRGDYVAEKTGVQRAQTPAESLRAAEQFTASMRQAKELLTPELNFIEKRVVQPASQFLAVLENVKKFMLKRNHKLLDYDRHRDNYRKLKDNKNRDASDERRLAKLEQELELATREYESVNNLLKSQLPILFQLRVQFIDPVFQSFYFYQLKVFQTLQNLFADVGSRHFDLSTPVMQGFDARRLNSQDIFAELSLLNRKAGPLSPSSVGSGGSGNGSESGGYNSTGASSTIPAAAGMATSYPPPPSYETSTTASYSRSPPQQTSQQQQQQGFSYGMASATTTATPAFRKSAPPPPPTGAKFVIALYDFDGQADGDLSFKKDDKIEVIQKTDSVNDWWTGKCRGVVGVFPANYCREA